MRCWWYKSYKLISYQYQCYLTSKIVVVLLAEMEGIRGNNRICPSKHGRSKMVQGSSLLLKLTGNHVDLCGFTWCDHQIPPAKTVALLSQASLSQHPTICQRPICRPSTPNCRRQDPPGKGLSFREPVWSLITSSLNQIPLCKCLKYDYHCSYPYCLFTWTIQYDCFHWHYGCYHGCYHKL